MLVPLIRAVEEKEREVVGTTALKESGFRGLAPSLSSAYGGGGYYNSPSHSGNSYNSWARDQPQNVYYRQGEGGGGGEMGWNSSSPYEQGQRRSRSSGGASGYAASPGGGQSSWSYSGGYDEQWSGQQSPWRRQSGELIIST